MGVELVCLAEKSGTMLILYNSDLDHAYLLDIHSVSTTMVAGWRGSLNYRAAVPYEINWLEFFMSRLVSTKASRQSTLGYTHGSSLSVDGARTTNSTVTQDTDKLFIQVRPPSWRNTYVLRLVVLICAERI